MEESKTPMHPTWKKYKLNVECLAFDPSRAFGVSEEEIEQMLCLYCGNIPVHPVSCTTCTSSNNKNRPISGNVDQFSYSLYCKNHYSKMLVEGEACYGCKRPLSTTKKGLSKQQKKIRDKVRIKPLEKFSIDQKYKEVCKSEENDPQKYIKLNQIHEEKDYEEIMSEIPDNIVEKIQETQGITLDSGSSDSEHSLNPNGTSHNKNPFSTNLSGKFLAVFAVFFVILPCISILLYPSMQEVLAARLSPQFVPPVMPTTEHPVQLLQKNTTVEFKSGNKSMDQDSERIGLKTEESEGCTIQTVIIPQAPTRVRRVHLEVTTIKKVYVPQKRINGLKVVKLRIQKKNHEIGTPIGKGLGKMVVQVCTQAKRYWNQIPTLKQLIHEYSKPWYFGKAYETTHEIIRKAYILLQNCAEGISVMTKECATFQEYKVESKEEQGWSSTVSSALLNIAFCHTNPTQCTWSN
ncbi:unnamed protein product [Moneuplotes crassus]|uniref:Uncharacterized protein n=1 Tax=Euplotes crassus TaxID=5936 RepID=A0AAD1X2L5_EUPCR|nr:unnamed protein product [Moneuplotes crassus]